MNISIAAIADRDDAYSLSLPLIASALAHDSAQYKSLSQKIQTAMESSEDNAFKAWLLGRRLLAADLIKDSSTLDQLQLDLSTLLSKLKFNSHQYASQNYAMYSWAICYLARLNTKEYNVRSQELQSTIVNLENSYKKMRQNESMQESELHDMLSNVVWAQIMALTAAANVEDRKIYTDILQQIKSITGQDNITSAIENSLTRTDSSSDYPAWALSLIRYAAVQLQDEVMYAELQNIPYYIERAVEWGNAEQQSHTNLWKATAEVILATLINQQAETLFEDNTANLKSFM